MQSTEPTTTLDTSIAFDGVDVFHLMAPLAEPRRNAFGEMSHRPALLVRLHDRRGQVGWGEGFCNWPVFGGYHRQRIVTDLLAPSLAGREFPSPQAMWQWLTDRFRPISLQANEPGPFEQTIAALDLAAWDMVARRAGLPLHALLSAASKEVPPGPVVPLKAYASALTGQTAPKLVPPLIDDGWEGFKIKVGFGHERDLRDVEALRHAIGSRTIMLDANQRWTLDQALSAAELLALVEPLFLEEPISADAPLCEWKELAEHSAIPLAAGENIRGIEPMLAAAGPLTWIQPDPIKWGGLSGVASIARNVSARGARFCPHYLGGGIGLLATAHLAMAFGSGWLELDVTENPLRDQLAGGGMGVEGGLVRLSDAPGIGVTPPDHVLERYAA